MKISEMKTSEFENNLCRSIGLAYQYAGHKIDPNDLVSLTRNTASVLCENFPNITFEDVDKAIMKGSLGEFGDYVNISTRAIFGFVKSYMSRTVVNAKIEYDDVTEAREPRDFELDMKNLINTCYKCFNKNGYWFGPNADIKDFLASHRLIVIDNAVLENARVRVEGRLKDEFTERRKIGQTLGGYISENFARSVDALIVKDFFNKMVVNKVEMIFKV